MSLPYRAFTTSTPLRILSALQGKFLADISMQQLRWRVGPNRDACRNDNILAFYWQLILTRSAKSFPSVVSGVAPRSIAAAR